MDGLSCRQLAVVEPNTSTFYEALKSDATSTVSNDVLTVSQPSAAQSNDDELQQLMQVGEKERE